MPVSSRCPVRRPPPARHPRRDRHRTARLDRVLHRPADLMHACGWRSSTFRADTDSTNLPRGAPAVCPSPAAPAQRLRIGQPNPNPAQAWPWPMPPSRRNTCPRHLQPDDVAFCNREPASRPGPGAPRSSIRAWNGRSGRPCGTRAITAMCASPSPAPITQCERNLNTSASAAGYRAVRHPHTEVKVAGLFGRRLQLAAGASGRFIRTRTTERPSRSASTTKRPHAASWASHRTGSPARAARAATIPAGSRPQEAPQYELGQRLKTGKDSTSNAYQGPPSSPTSTKPQFTPSHQHGLRKSVVLPADLAR